ncbi:uncharacterized protein MYCFIDRAFT_180487 [Pseudocercospora fijiensis CIRAD86]|uniref:Uncharacterized protein n=1 Tax=Pseudocercospora fijiensis (strain CIRAD86) TaxID=383855 RepID=M2ZY06_PSEFD|nr:uncharacterized protein MYCFIDRAFT_180487 [Pseudocercospora fijiensis CIRAD86]EME77001.1 hypothetical protein MYCFIDRAFT_180487 [Pseudocercospora fijiensis CIRAD86]
MNHRYFIVQITDYDIESWNLTRPTLNQASQLEFNDQRYVAAKQILEVWLGDHGGEALVGSQSTIQARPLASDLEKKERPDTGVAVPLCAAKRILKFWIGDYGSEALSWPQHAIQARPLVPELERKEQSYCGSLLWAGRQILEVRLDDHSGEAFSPRGEAPACRSGWATPPLYIADQSCRDFPQADGHTRLNMKDFGEWALRFATGIGVDLCPSTLSSAVEALWLLFLSNVGHGKAKWCQYVADRQFSDFAPRSRSESKIEDVIRRGVLSCWGVSGGQHTGPLLSPTGVATFHHNHVRVQEPLLCLVVIGLMEPRHGNRVLISIVPPSPHQLHPAMLQWSLTMLSQLPPVQHEFRPSNSDLSSSLTHTISMKTWKWFLQSLGLEMPALAVEMLQHAPHQRGITDRSTMLFRVVRLHLLRCLRYVHPSLFRTSLCDEFFVVNRLADGSILRSDVGAPRRELGTARWTRGWIQMERIGGDPSRWGGLEGVRFRQVTWLCASTSHFFNGSFPFHNGSLQSGSPAIMFSFLRIYPHSHLPTSAPPSPDSWLELSKAELNHLHDSVRVPPPRGHGTSRRRLIRPILFCKNSNGATTTHSRDGRNDGYCAHCARTDSPSRSMNSSRSSSATLASRLPSILSSWESVKESRRYGKWKALYRAEQWIRMRSATIAPLRLPYSAAGNGRKSRGHRALHQAEQRMRARPSSSTLGSWESVKESRRRRKLLIGRSSGCAQENVDAISAISDNDHSHQHSLPRSRSPLTDFENAGQTLPGITFGPLSIILIIPIQVPLWRHSHLPGRYTETSYTTLLTHSTRQPDRHSSLVVSFWLWGTSPPELLPAHQNRKTSCLGSWVSQRASPLRCLDELPRLIIQLVPGAPIHRDSSNNRYEKSDQPIVDVLQDFSAKDQTEVDTIDDSGLAVIMEVEAYPELPSTMEVEAYPELPSTMEFRSEKRAALTRGLPLAWNVGYDISRGPLKAPSAELSIEILLAALGSPHLLPPYLVPHQAHRTSENQNSHHSLQAERLGRGRFFVGGIAHYHFFSGIMHKDGAAVLVNEMEDVPSNDSKEKELATFCVLNHVAYMLTSLQVTLGFPCTNARVSADPGMKWFPQSPTRRLCRTSGEELASHSITPQHRVLYRRIPGRCAVDELLHLFSPKGEVPEILIREGGKIERESRFFAKLAGSIGRDVANHSSPVSSDPTCLGRFPRHKQQRLDAHLESLAVYKYRLAVSHVLSRDGKHQEFGDPVRIAGYLFQSALKISLNQSCQKKVSHRNAACETLPHPNRITRVGHSCREGMSMKPLRAVELIEWDRIKVGHRRPVGCMGLCLSLGFLEVLRVATETEHAGRYMFYRITSRSRTRYESLLRSLVSHRCAVGDSVDKVIGREDWWLLDWTTLVAGSPRAIFLKDLFLDWHASVNGDCVAVGGVMQGVAVGHGRYVGRLSRHRRSIRTDCYSADSPTVLEWVLGGFRSLPRGPSLVLRCVQVLAPMGAANVEEVDESEGVVGAQLVEVIPSSCWSWKWSRIGRAAMIQTDCPHPTRRSEY